MTSIAHNPPRPARPGRTVVLILLLLPLAAAAPGAAQTAEPWYKDMPEKAALSEDGRTMRIGDKSYPVYNAFDPIAPTGGERVLDFAGALDYYFWFHRRPGSAFFTMSKIGLDMTIFYIDDQTRQFTTPRGEVWDDAAGGAPR